ncbi:class I SAM-dependent methyltransferase [Methanofollis sp. UBA420]|jgi:ubiquinone/menaquinone biosynthesis C-methylase UbiE|uniref:class I SAM-dependent methyltransferase n=1 Tax=Methanofollis sp. UBA420 TaxID=1915514 RepID=UPI00316AE41C
MTVNLVDHLEKVHEFSESDFRWKNLRKLVYKDVIGKSILDAGCGTGDMTLHLLNAGYDVTAIDYSEELVTITQKTIESKNYKAEVCQLDLCNARCLGHNRYDTIVCLDVIEHVEDDKRALQNIYYTLKKGGNLIISVPACNYLYSTRDKQVGHYRRYIRSDLLNTLTDCKFKVLETRYWNFIGVIPYFISGKLLKKEIYEGMRYSRDSQISKGINYILDNWFSIIENNVRPPIGLTLYIVCTKD